MLRVSALAAASAGAAAGLRACHAECSPGGAAEQTQLLPRRLAGAAGPHPRHGALAASSPLAVGVPLRVADPPLAAKLRLAPGAPASDAAAAAESMVSAALLVLARDAPGDWRLEAERDGVRVWLADPAAAASMWPGAEAGLPVLRSAAVLDASPGAVADMLMDSARTVEYNAFSVGRVDLDELDEHTKVVWNRTRVPVTGARRETVTLMRRVELEGGGVLVVSRAVERPGPAPRGGAAARDEVVLGVNLLLPGAVGDGGGGGGDRCTMVCVTQVRAPGLPAWMAASVQTRGALDFLRGLRAALAR